MPIATVNPATGEVIKTFQSLSEAEIEKKLQLAVKVFHGERKTPFAVRAQRMRKAAEILWMRMAGPPDKPAMPSASLGSCHPSG